MRERTSNRLRGLHRAPRSAYRRFRLLVPVLLFLGILIGSDLTGQQTQPVPTSDKKPIDKDKDLPKKDSPPALPQAQPVPPQATDVFVTGIPPNGPAQRFQFKIDPKTPLKDLLPPAPEMERATGPIQGNDLSRIPEVQFEAPLNSTNAEARKHIAHLRAKLRRQPEAESANTDAIKHIAHQIAKINHLNDKKTDGFIEALQSERSDLTGLPFAMGDTCRTKGERSKQFAHAVALVRQALQSPVPASGPVPVQPSGPAPTPPPSVPQGSSAPATPQDTAAAARLGSDLMFSTTTTFQGSVNPPAPETFWEQYQSLCRNEDKTKTRREQRELITCARIAALTQILMPMPQMHPGFARYLSTVSHVEATKALARLAIFSGEEEARKAAIEALKVRRERDYTDILVNGLHYPWPNVARRAAQAITKLERNDLVPQLIDVLDQPDPRAPVTREIKGKSVPVVRELVRVNHHRSCLMCHAPGNTGKVSADAVTAEVPVPGQPLTPPSGGYATSQPDILVRVDVTYLRQDFSTFLAVADANPWPEMQRFDFLVRSRQLSDEEATAYREKLKSREPGAFSPYHRAALAALRELTGRDTEPTPEAWRRLLKLPAESRRETGTP